MPSEAHTKALVISATNSSFAYSAEPKLPDRSRPSREGWPLQWSLCRYRHNLHYAACRLPEYAECAWIDPILPPLLSLWIGIIVYVPEGRLSMRLQERRRAPERHFRRQRPRHALPSWPRPPRQRAVRA